MHAGTGDAVPSAGGDLHIPISRRGGGAPLVAVLLATLLSITLSRGDGFAQTAPPPQGDQGLQAGWAVDDGGDSQFWGSVATRTGVIADAGARWIRINFRLGGCFSDWTSVG